MQVIDQVTVTFSVNKARWLARLLEQHPNMTRERESLERMVRWREGQRVLPPNLPVSWRS